MRALRPAAALLDPSQCVAGPVCLVEQGRIVRWCEADELPAGLEVEEFPDELGIFWDYPCLFQHPPGGKRTEEQDRVFKVRAA